MGIKNSDVSIVWPISLLGLPISCGIFLFSLAINTFLFGELTPEKPIYAVIMSSILFAMLCGLTNVFFSFYTLSTFWNSLNFLSTLKYFAILIIMNIFSGYVFARLWSKNTDIKVYSFLGKRKFGQVDLIAFYFYFFSFVVIVIPMFIVSKSA